MKTADIKYSNIFIFFLILGLLNAVISSSSLRIFTSFSSNFGNDPLTLLPFYLFVLLLSIIIFLFISILKIKFWVFLKLLTLTYLGTFLAPTIISKGYNALVETCIIYFLIIFLFYGLDNFFKRKLNYSEIFIKLILIISLSTVVVDAYYVFNYLKSPIYVVEKENDNKNINIKLNHNNFKTKNVFYIVFDQVSPQALLKNSRLNENLFFKKIDDGIYFNNTWTNGHRTALSLNQHLNGYFTKYSKPFIHHTLKARAISSNYFLYNKHCTNRHSLTCYDVKDLIKHKHDSFLNEYYISKMIYALELKFNLPIFQALQFLTLNKHIEGFEKKIKKKISYDLLNLQIDKINKTIFHGMENTYNFIYFYPPHHPYTYDKNCILKSDTSVISKDLSIEEMDNKAYLDQIKCMNKTILKLIKILKSKNLYQNSLIFITTDHSIGSVDTALKNKFGINSIRLENLKSIKLHQEYFNKIVNRRGKIPLWIKPAFHENGLTFDNRMILSLDLPATVIGAFNIHDKNLPGLNILDEEIDKKSFNARVKSMVMYNQYNKHFRPFTYLLKDRDDWTIIEEKEAITIEKNKFSRQ